jgi:Spy/CpxP family protein refolding chaperone
MWVTLLLTLILGMSLGVMLNELVLGGEKGERNERSSRSTDNDRESRSQRFKSWLQKELELAPEQVEQLEKLLDGYSEKSRQISSQSQKAYHDLRMEFRQEVRTFLNPEQLERFNELMARHDERRQKSHNKQKR